MKTVSFYHQETGLFHPTSLTASDESIIALNAPPDHLAMEGAHDHLSRRVDVITGEIVDYQPPAPSTDHGWDETAKRWVLSQHAQELATRRGTALVEIRDVESRALGALIEHALGYEGARDRLEALHKQIVDLRAAFSAGG